MKSLLINNLSQKAIDDFIRQPSHGLLLVAPRGSGKGSVGKFIAAQLLNTTMSKLSDHPYFRLVVSADGKKISIDEIRSVIHFTLLKTAGNRQVNRLVLIEDSQLMTAEAQNALLKTIEEPPAGTVFLLTATTSQALLPTISSRLQQIQLKLPKRPDIQSFFEVAGYSQVSVERAVLISGGLIGLAHSLLAEDQSHSLVKATKIARSILQKLTFERLIMIDDLASDKQLCFDVLFTLSQMARISLQNNQKDKLMVQKWQRVLTSSHLATRQLLANAQPKLVLLNFMLSL